MKKFFRVLLAGFFCLMGILHFVAADLFVSVMPPYLPAPRALVLISGVCELLGGIGVLIPAVRRWVGYGFLMSNIHYAEPRSCFDRLSTNGECLPARVFTVRPEPVEGRAHG